MPGLKAVTVHFLPPNTTAVLQLMDQGKIQCFKSWYRKLLFEKMVNYMDNGMDCKVDVLQAMQFAAKAWDHVSQCCVTNCFRHAGWQREDDSEEDTLSNIVHECEAQTSILKNCVEKKRQLQPLRSIQMKTLFSLS